jgi:hypothetical protein
LGIVVPAISMASSMVRVTPHGTGGRKRRGPRRLCR